MIQPKILAVFFFVKMRNWHIGRDKENLVFTKKGRKIMRKIKRKKGYAGKMQEKIFGQIRVKIPHTQGDVACNTYRNRYLKPTQPSRLGLPLALWFVRIQARCHLCSHNSTWKSFRVAAASGHLTGTAYGQAVKP
ncbi:hypothetical protein LI147_13110 [Blautia wexlerae]|uniref:hypothetical protein n=1 Tax=Blautia wexlerae TaxID=418240 RepID=UPI001D0690D9|nr:hypothetical protein [Blautia wexlerae]MCB6687859.1 hypothetical protein [Blautia wexlerae]